MPDSIHLQVARLLQDGPLDTRQIEQRIPVSRKVLAKAYKTAIRLGWMKVKRQATKGRKASPAVFEADGPIGDIPVPGRRKTLPKVPVVHVRVSCVWDLALDKGIRIHGIEGQKYQPLGEW